MSDETKFWIIYSTDMDKHPPMKANSEEEAERIATRKATQSPGTHFYVLEAISTHVGLVDVMSVTLHDDLNVDY